MKVHILSPCPHCHGQAYLPVGEGQDYKGRAYTRFRPCPMCNGEGSRPAWVSLPEFARLLQQAACQHERTSHNGNRHFIEGDVWDDIEEVCDDCGKRLERQTLADFLPDDD